MPSRRARSVEPLDSFEEDVPITEDDVAAQAELRRRASMSSGEYLAWCTWITRDSISTCTDFHTERFEL